MSDVSVGLKGRVATVEICRGPHNYFDLELVRALADIYHELDAGGECRAIVLCSEGKNFCAGADFSRPTGGVTSLYQEAVRLFEAGIPVVAAVQGAAIGGGLGLACSADFRVASPQARLSANFARLGFHHGFGLTETLPRIIGPQRALELLYTGRRIDGSEAAAMGLCDRLVDPAELRAHAHALATEIAESAPLAVRAIRETMRGDLADRVRGAVEHEAAEQARLMRTGDFAEGVRAMVERRTPAFTGQ
ncbi:enoyl-CoA hydratase/isomerase family protein [Nonomuraea sp. NPDC050536]|uniref:enoyl-CoA hydratase/isomerase family protein n=1 Tax=Nonomuraea sp. NPDC050536 TaxID=3364366 RepID=UPI0037C72632